MAPEQAAADPHVDHRADLYALGVLGYEMLTGQPPFMGATPQATLAAQVTKKPDPVTTTREAIPAALNALVMRCLEKHPADRWQTGTEVLQQLDVMATPSGGWPPTSEALPLSSGTRAALRPAHPLPVIGSLVASGVLRERERLLLADFQNRSTDSTLGPTLSEAFRIDLSQSPTVKLVDAQTVTDEVQRMRRAAGTTLDLALARELAVRLGIKAVLTGQIDPVGHGYVLSASLVSAGDGQVLTGVRETADNEAALIPALDPLSQPLPE